MAEAILDPTQSTFVEANIWADSERPSSETLLQLANDGTPEAFETLRELAERYNVDYSEDTTPTELYDRISLKMEQEADNEKLS